MVDGCPEITSAEGQLIWSLSSKHGKLLAILALSSNANFTVAGSKFISVLKMTKKSIDPIVKSIFPKEYLIKFSFSCNFLASYYRKNSEIP
jgi:hypothetical protein